MSDPSVDVLIPTYRRQAALAVTLSGVANQDFPRFRVIISDQSPPSMPSPVGEVAAMVRVLEATGHPVAYLRHRPRRGLAEHRQFLLDQATAPYVLFLDDDIWLQRDVLRRLVAAIEREGCGFVGSAPIGLSFEDDRRPDQQDIEVWHGPVRPERVRPDQPAWARHRLHSAANLWHVQQRMADPGASVLYKVAWVGGCVLFETATLRDAGGFGFWDRLPVTHAGEDVLAQLRVMERKGGAAILPSGAFHLELPTTVPIRRVDAPYSLAI